MGQEGTECQAKVLVLGGQAESEQGGTCLSQLCFWENQQRWRARGKLEGHRRDI